jgi:preprotein translocase subunit SecG
MTTLFVILIIIACVALCFIVLIQNPKGGGLSENVSGVSNQLMGVKKTTDVLEKGTWIFASVIAVLALTSMVFLRAGKGGNDDVNKTIKSINPPAATSQPAPPTQPATNSTTIPAKQ